MQAVPATANAASDRRFRLSMGTAVLSQLSDPPVATQTNRISTHSTARRAYAGTLEGKIRVRPQRRHLSIRYPPGNLRAHRVPLTSPVFNLHGNLPPDIHWVTWKEMAEVPAFGPRRVQLLAGLEEAVNLLRMAGCRSIVYRRELCNGESRIRRLRCLLGC